MAKASLVIMAAGLGSRFGGGIKQLTPVGVNGEIIMDYSIHDAIAAGFDKIIFIIRKDIEDDFKEIIFNRIVKICKPLNVECAYCFQDINDLPKGFTLPDGRTKPWGTGHAVLAARNLIKEPFLVINADDYYGVEGFNKIYNYLMENKDNKYAFCMAGFILKNTLSDNGSVNRGIVTADNNDFLMNVVETTSIIKTLTGASANGVELDINAHCSMNMWGLTYEFVEELEKDFEKFTKNLSNPIKDEYYVHMAINSLIQSGKATCKVLETTDKWLGVTYQEDKDFVIDSIKKLIEDKVYNAKLFSDLK